MADRYTQKDANQCGKFLADTLKKKFGECYDGNGKAIPGCWVVDYQSMYGGAVIEQITNPEGGVTHPFGSKRMNAESFCFATHMAEKSVEIDREKR